MCIQLSKLWRNNKKSRGPFRLFTLRFECIRQCDADDDDGSQNKMSQRWIWFQKSRTPTPTDRSTQYYVVDKVDRYHTIAFRIEQLLCFILFGKKNYILQYILCVVNIVITWRWRTNDAYNESKEDKTKRTNKTKAILKWTHLICDKKKKVRMLSSRLAVTDGLWVLLLVQCHCNRFYSTHLTHQCYCIKSESLSSSSSSSLSVSFLCRLIPIVWSEYLCFSK